MPPLQEGGEVKVAQVKGGRVWTVRNRLQDLTRGFLLRSAARPLVRKYQPARPMLKAILLGLGLGLALTIASHYAGL